MLELRVSFFLPKWLEMGRKKLKKLKKAKKKIAPGPESNTGSGV
jgi:hypothetical protein